jgi:hypothetical protein
VTEVSNQFLAAVENIIAHVEPDGDVTLCESMDVVRQVLRAKAERAAEVEQFLVEREVAGAALDPATAEVASSYGRILDPYGVNTDDLSAEPQCVGRIYFARAPGSDLWISFYDLPNETAKVLWARMKAGEFDHEEEDFFMKDDS